MASPAASATLSGLEVVDESSNRFKNVVRLSALLAAFTFVLWLEIQMLFSIRVAVFAHAHPCLLEVLHVLLLASCVVLARAFPTQINQTRLTLVVAFGGPVALWVSVRGWAPSYVGINVGPFVGYWILLHCVMAGAFLLIALLRPRTQNAANTEGNPS